MRIPTPDIVNVSMWWIDKALTYMGAEAEAEKIISDRKK